MVMNRNLTDAELSEPYVTLIIPENRTWEIPKHIVDELRLYIGRYDNAGNMVYKVPAYLYREWTNALTQNEDTNGNA